MAFPRGVREIAARQAASPFPCGPIEIVGQRPQPSPCGVPERSCGPAEILVVVVVLVLGAMGTLVVPARLTKGSVAAQSVPDSRLLPVPSPS